MTQRSHPESGQILDFIEGRLPPDVHRNISAHLVRCHSCRAELAVWRSLTYALTDEAIEAPPNHLRAWARRLPVFLRAESGRSRLLRLVIDSWQTMTAIGQPSGGLAPALRSAADEPLRSGRRRLLFSSLGFDLDLEIDYPGSSEPRHLHGQVLPYEGPRRLWQGAEILLVGPGRSRAGSRLDRRGEFFIPRLKPGRYRVDVRGPIRSKSPAIEV